MLTSQPHQNATTPLLALTFAASGSGAVGETRMTYHARSWLAIATGIVASLGALAILLQDPITTHQWRLDHGLLPIVVAVTIAAGHLLGTALRWKRFISAVGFLAIFLFGTALTVYSSVGSQKAQSGDKALSVEHHNKAVAEKRSELENSRVRLAHAENMVEKEVANKRCAQACQSWKDRVAEIRSHRAILEVQLERLGSEKIARPKARALAEAAVIFGFDQRQIETAASVLEPFAYSLLLELSAIVAFGFGFGHNRPATVAQPVKQALTFERPLTDAEIEELKRKLQLLGGRVEMQDDLVAHLGVHKGEVSKRIAKAVKAGAVRVERNGRQNAVVLNTLH